ncbi:MAG: hypothetical protein Q9219_006275 [cf. Caloplaca sp. 3 TL-2023]
MSVYYQSRQSEIYGGTISLIVLATVSVLIRLIARQKSAARLWWDDFIIVVALIFDWGLSASYWMQVRYCGLGRHTNAAGGPVGPVQLLKFFKLFLAIQIMYFASAVSIKTSLILLYYRIFGVVRWFRWLLAAVWAAVFLYFVVCLFVAVFECSPVAYYWDKSIKNGSCINQNQFYRWNGVANLLIDFAIWSLTLPVVWHLRLSFRQKLSLSFVFVLGLLPLIARFLKGVKNSNDESFGTKMTPTSIPLSQYNARHGVRGSSDTSNGFVRLTDGGTVGNGSVTAQASKGEDNQPIVTDAIIKQQRLEQHVGHASQV